MKHLMIAAFALAFVAAGVQQYAVHNAAESDLHREVAVQCASVVSGRFDAQAEGDAVAVPSPLWDDLVAECDAEFDNGATYREAEARVYAANAR